MTALGTIAASTSSQGAGYTLSNTGLQIVRYDTPQSFFKLWRVSLVLELLFLIAPKHHKQDSMRLRWLLGNMGLLLKMIKIFFRNGMLFNHVHTVNHPELSSANLM